MMAHGAELLFTVSGKGSSEQEKQYNYPTSIALSYDPAYGAMMADSAPDEVLNDPNHPLYYHYITPVRLICATAEAALHTAARCFLCVASHSSCDDLPAGCVRRRFGSALHQKDSQHHDGGQSQQ